MIKYIINRFLISLFTLFVIITLIFFLIRLLPGDPFNSDKNIPAQVKANMLAKFGLDKPLIQQYFIYFSNVITKGDMGPSMKYVARPVSNIITYSFPASAKVGFLVILASVIGGVNLGILSALNQGKFLDRFTMLMATIGVTVPSFVLANLLILFFSLYLKVLPPTGYGQFRHLIMPVIALTGYSMAFITRLTRSKYLEIVQLDYIRTARAKGLKKFKVIFKHALRNSIIPVVTYLGPLIAGVLTGSFVIETIFAIPGLGREFVQSIGNRDYTLILGVSIFYSCLIIACNFIVDILYVLIDPRIKLDNVDA